METRSKMWMSQIRTGKIKKIYMIPPVSVWNSLTPLRDLGNFDSDPQEEIHVIAFKTPLPVLGWPHWCDILLYAFQMVGGWASVAIRLLLICCRRRRARCSSVSSPCLSALFPVSFYKTSSKDEAGRLSEAPTATCSSTCLGLHIHCSYCMCSCIYMSAHIEWKTGLLVSSP